MFTGDVTLIIAFFAGLVSFLAPCVLPLVPGFLAYLGGSSIEGKEAKSSEAGSPERSEERFRESRKQIFLNSLFFVIGFSVVFAALGVLLNTVLQSVASDVQTWLSRIGGAIIIVFGLYLTGLIRARFLEREHKMKVKQGSRSRYATSFLFGLAFAAGWTPCVGPALGVILGLAASQPGLAFSLLLAYSFGLGLPFLLVGAFTARANRFIQRYAHIAGPINIVFGIFLLALGVLVFTETLSLIASFDFVNDIISRS